MRAVVLLVVLVATTSQAVSNLDVGADHRLIGSTTIGVRTVASTEFIRLSVRSWPAASVTVNVSGGGVARHTVVVASNAQGWFGTSPLVLQVPPGEYSVTFTVPGVAPADARFDFDLAVTDSAGLTPRSGRVFSRRWEFDSGSYLRLTNTSFYVRVPVGSSNVVWQLALSGLAGWQFQVMSNRIGVEPPVSGRSVPMTMSWLLPEFEVYLETPDLPITSQPPGTLSGVAQLADGLRIGDSSAGTLSIDVDLDGDGIAPSNARERLFAVRVPGGAYDVTMDWRDGLGNEIPAGTYSGFATLATDEIHFTAVDVEYCLPGIRMFQLTDAGVLPSAISWDDTLIDDGTIGRPFAQQVATGAADAGALAGINAHGWGGPLGNAEGPGNRTYIDTWTSATVTRVAFPVVSGVARDQLPTRDDPAPPQSWVTPRPDAGLAVGASFDGGSGDAGSVDAGSADAGWAGDAADAGQNEADAGWAGDAGDAADAGQNEADAGLVLLPPPRAEEEFVFEIDAGPSGAGETAGFTGGGGCSSSAALPLVAVLLTWLRRRRGVAVAMLVAAPLAARAFDTETLEPIRLSTSSPTSSAGTSARSEITLTAGFSRNAVLWAGQPVVSDLFSNWLSASISVLPMLSLEGGMGLLVAPVGGANTLWSGVQLTDAMAGARLRFAPLGPLSFSVFAHGRVPTRGQADFIGGAAGASGGASVAAQLDRVQLGVELTAAAATARRSFFRARAGGSVRTVGSLHLGLEAEALVWLQPRDDVKAAVPIEARASARWLGEEFSVGVVGGVGLTNGVGAPDARVLVTVGVTLPSLVKDAPTEPTRFTPAAVTPPPLFTDATTRLVVVIVSREGGARATDAEVLVAGGCLSEGEGRFLCPLESGDEFAVRADGCYPALVRATSSPSLEVVLLPRHPDFRVSAREPLDLEVYFETNSDELRADATSRLELVAARLRASTSPLVLSAHADVRGDSRDNLMLSLRRGDAVRQFLRSRGVTVPLVVEPRGEDQARVREGTDAALQVDRRVIVKPLDGR